MGRLEIRHTANSLIRRALHQRRREIPLPIGPTRERRTSSTSTRALLPARIQGDGMKVSRSRYAAVVVAVVAMLSSCGPQEATIDGEVSAEDSSTQTQELRKNWWLGHHHFHLDAGTPNVADAGTTTPPRVDAGTPPPRVDAGTPPRVDAGTPPPVVDAGTPPPRVDAGTPPPPVDAGVPPRSGERVLEVSAAKRLNALMLTCGAYDAAGDFAFRVGLPAKSGVGGGIRVSDTGRMRHLRVVTGTRGIGQLAGRVARARTAHHADAEVNILRFCSRRLAAADHDISPHRDWRNIVRIVSGDSPLASRNWSLANAASGVMSPAGTTPTRLSAAPVA